MRCFALNGDFDEQAHATLRTVHIITCYAGLPETERRVSVARSGMNRSKNEKQAQKKKSRYVELEEDYAMLAGLSEEADPSEPFVESVASRLPWLSMLLVIGMGVSGVIGLFEKITAELPIIVSFQSLILGMAGNAGTQSLAVTIRSLLDERLTARRKAGLVWREARIGAANGILLGSLSFAAIGAYLHLARRLPAGFAFSVSFCTGAAMCVSILLSSVTGTVIPVLFRKIKIDPAVASGPFITTVNDLVAVVTYYGIAWALLVS